MLTTDAGMMIDVKFVYANAFDPMLVKREPAENDTEDKEPQPAKALPPMLVTEAGIMIDVNPELLKTPPSILAS